MEANQKKTLFIVGGSLVGLYVIYLIFKPSSAVVVSPVTGVATTSNTTTTAIANLGTSLVNAFFGGGSTTKTLGTWVNGVRKNSDGSVDYDNGNGTFTEVDKNGLNSTLYNNDGSLVSTA